LPEHHDGFVEVTPAASYAAGSKASLLVASRPTCSAWHCPPGL
jgi:hypothetical protein